jgi:predicted double-glycine peptidase
MHRLDVPYFKQDTAYSCGAASAQMVLAYFGIRTAEERLMHTLHTNHSYGTHHQPLIKLFTDHGLYCYTNNESELEELATHIEAGCPSIVHYLEPEADEGHYAVVTGVSESAVILHDPWHGPHFHLPRADFLSRWHDEREDFPRWYCAVSSEVFNTGRQYRPQGD